MKTFTTHSHELKVVVTIALALLLAAPQLRSQSVQVAYNATSKTALVDHMRLRKEYKALNAARERMVDLHLAAKRSFDASLNELSLQKESELKADKSKGWKNNEQITKEYAAKKSKLTADYYAEQKLINQNMNAQMQAYENRITAMIEIVVSQRGFTEVKPLKAGENQKGIDITSLVIEKLN